MSVINIKRIGWNTLATSGSGSRSVTQQTYLESIQLGSRWLEKFVVLRVGVDGAQRLGARKQRDVKRFRNRVHYKRTFLVLLPPLGAVTVPSYSGGCGV